eukprot:TRINITY_DN16980_c0_g1_i1.p1 TRINITY_DN16980_c0_g1~~TRINITY_DN16980_c0_g1_i1.p1  ORF type:complete len:961 (+),score=166.76 TRINITY_DN16980_c0_g1_i1:102-2984(+)
MVKAYLKYEIGRSVGVITSRECNIAFDHTGKLALAGCVESVVVWSIRQGAAVRTLRTSKAAERVTRICMKDGHGGRPVCAVGYGDGAVRLWNYEDASVLMTLHGHKSIVSSLAFDRAGHLLASGSHDTDIVIWDIVSETGVARLRGHVDQITAVVFWSGDEGSSGGRTSAGDATSSSGVVSEDCRLVSASKDRFVRIWSVMLQLCLQTIPEHKVEVWSLALNASQTRLVCGSADKYLRFFALKPNAEGTENDQLASYLGDVPRPNGQGGLIAMEYVQPKGVDYEVLLCQGAGKVLEMFRCQNEEDVKRRQKRRKQRAKLKQRKKNAERMVGEGEVEGDEAAGGEVAQTDSALPRAADEIAELLPRRGGAKAASLAWCAKTSTVLLGLANNSVETIRIGPPLSPKESDEATDGVVVETSICLDIPGHRTGVRSLAVSPDDSMVMSTSSEAIKIWNTATGNCVRTMPSGYGLCGFFVSGNEHVLIGTKEGSLELHDMRVAEVAQTIDAHSGSVYGLAENPNHDGFVSCSADKHIRFFHLVFTKSKDGASENVAVEEQADRVTELPDECLAVAYSPNGKWVAVALLNHTVQMFFADTLKFYLSLYGHRLPVMSLDFSSDSQIVASGSADKNVKLWSTQFGNCHKSLRAHEESVMQVRFLPGTHYLASAGRDKEVKLWDCDTYELITALRGHASEILAMSLSQDADFLVTAGSDRQIRFWKRGQEQLFLSEERSREMEEKFEREVEREDVQATTDGASQVSSVRPSRRTIESVRSTERLMEILEKAKDQTEGSLDPAALALMGHPQHPCLLVIRYINTLTANNIYEVLLALPFSYTKLMLRFICEFLDAVAALPDGKGANDGDESDARLLSAAATLSTPCQAALIAAYVHHSELASTRDARALLLQLRQRMRALLQAEKDRIGFSMAGIGHLQRILKRAGTFSEATASAPGGAAGTKPSKKQRK